MCPFDLADHQWSDCDSVCVTDSNGKLCDAHRKVVWLECRRASSTGDVGHVPTDDVAVADTEEI